MSATWAPPRIVSAELPDWKLEDAVAVAVSILQLECRDFGLICKHVAEANLTNEQRLFLLRMAVAPTVCELREPRLGEDEIDG